MTKKAALSRLSRESLRQEHRVAFARELTGESDRSATLVAAAELDGCLVLLLRSKLSYRLTDVERDALFFDMGAPLSSLSNRTQLAYALGLLHQDERDDLDAIRRVRNAFAHSVLPLTFERDEINKACARLHYRGALGDESASFGNPRLRYLLTAVGLRNILLDRVLATLKQGFDEADASDESSKAILAEANAIIEGIERAKAGS